MIIIVVYRYIFIGYIDKIMIVLHYFLFLAEANLKEQVEKSFNLPPTYETVVSRAQLATVSDLNNNIMLAFYCVSRNITPEKEMTGPGGGS